MMCNHLSQKQEDLIAYQTPKRPSWKKNIFNSRLSIHQENGESSLEKQSGLTLQHMEH
jgi:hypothetical protein